MVQMHKGSVFRLLIFILVLALTAPFSAARVTAASVEKIAIPTPQKIFVDGLEVNMAVYSIEQQNYFRLADLSAVLGFGATYDPVQNAVMITTMNTTENIPAPTPSPTQTPVSAATSTQPAPDPAVEKPFSAALTAAMNYQGFKKEEWVMTRKSLNGIEFAEFYLDSGMKKPILFYFVNFKDATGYTYGFLADRFAQYGVYVVMVEMEGKGESARPGPDLALDLWIENAEAIDTLVDYYKGRTDGQADATRFIVDGHGNFDNGTVAFIQAATGRNKPSAIVFGSGTPDPGFNDFGRAKLLIYNEERDFNNPSPVTQELRDKAKAASAFTNIERFIDIPIYGDVDTYSPASEGKDRFAAFTEELKAIGGDIREIYLSGESEDTWDLAERYVREAFGILNNPSIYDFDQYIDETGEIVMAKFTGSGEDISIPNKFAGRPPGIIGQNAFAGNITLKRVTLPASIYLIEENSFSGCINLSEVILNSYWPPVVGDLAFSNLAPGAKAIVPANSTDYGEEGGLWNGLVISYGDFTAVPTDKPAPKPARTDEFHRHLNEDGDAVADKYVGFGYVVIIPEAFVGDSVTLGKPITIIGEEAFAGDIRIASVSLPSGIKLIRRAAFAGCVNLSEIIINSKTPPEVEEGAFDNIAPGAKAIIPADATGYGAEGSNWNGLLITYAE